MANASNSPVLIPEALFLPIELSRAMEMVSETNRQVFQAMETLVFPIQQINKAIASMMEPIREAQKLIASYPFVKMVEEIQETNKRMVELMTIRPVIPYLRYTDIIDGEIKEENKTTIVKEMQTAIVPQATPLPAQVIFLPTKRVWGKMRLKQISGGNFSYKRVTLKGLSLRNREGQVLGFILANPDLFISDEIMLEKFYAKDTFARSKLIQLLKDKFRSNCLQAVIERQGDGYILIEIKYLQ